MKSDATTKVLLTVIALCLLWICLKHAQMVALAKAQLETSPHEPEPVGDKRPIGFTNLPFAIQ